jgi:hypothetical protein
MNLRRNVLASVVGLGLVAGGVMIAQDHPERDVSRARHPNLAAAQRLTDQAFNKITAAQQANEFDMDGHAAKAKELLEQANHELKEATEAANHHDKR